MDGTAAQACCFGVVYSFIDTTSITNGIKAQSINKGLLCKQMGTGVSLDVDAWQGMLGGGKF